MFPSAESSAVLCQAIICIKYFFFLLSRILLLMKPYFEHEIVTKKKKCHYPEKQQ